MNKNSLAVIFIIAVAVISGAGILYVLYSPDPGPVPAGDQTNQPVLGGDVDEYGCRGSAGYSWCAPKNTCLRIWETPCYSDLDAEIQNVLAGKYNKPLSDVAVRTVKQSGDYAYGSVKFSMNGDFGEGGLWLATKENSNVWKVAWDGNGLFDCSQMRALYNWPEEIIGYFCRN